ncbi:4Fe-4S dicluster domain-containing protein [Candidatus Methanoperedens nitratireducens]|uniref:4Fe-4S dicluster domain-containing protein n=1 Tax=Candidatus Methanoperedens nitratireducens TaxID=1392998 RepID=UPI0009DDBC87|nr:4Fe-4S dicluster domain-containing protein [Candidatus Methanoperedens nitroreducens]
MKYAILEKQDLYRWVEYLKIKARLYAPKKKENLFVFGPVKNADEICLDYIPTILPPKKYYFPQKEKLLEFSIKPFKSEKAIKEFEEYILFGVHTCDIAGIQCLDVVFREYPEDPNYLNRKEKMTIIGIECFKYCDKYANCTSMGNNVPRGGYDLMMVDLGQNFIIHINSEKGERLVVELDYIKEAKPQDLAKLENFRNEKKKMFREELNAPLPEVYKAFSEYESFHSEVWNDVGRRCVACGNCTAVCPTCYCFDIVDELELTLNDGLRYRIWNYCQMDDFAKVATGEDFRKGRNSRQRHRYYRKFKYPVDKYNRYFCIGCGRCSRTCMADIILIETVDSIVDPANAQNYKGLIKNMPEVCQITQDTGACDDR